MARTQLARAVDDIAPVTRRQSKFDLEAALAEMDRNDADTTLNVSPEDHHRLMAQAFANMPSPLGDDAIEPPPPTLRAPTFQADTLEDLDYDLELETDDDVCASGVRRSYAVAAPPPPNSPTVLLVAAWSLALVAIAGTWWVLIAL